MDAAAARRERFSQLSTGGTKRKDVPRTPGATGAMKVSPEGKQTKKDRDSQCDQGRADPVVRKLFDDAPVSPREELPAPASDHAPQETPVPASDDATSSSHEAPMPACATLNDTQGQGTCRHRVIFTKLRDPLFRICLLNLKEQPSGFLFLAR